MPISREKQEEIDAIAQSMVEKIRSDKHEFWIDAEAHYNDHKKLNDFLSNLDGDQIHEVKEIIKLYKTTKGLFFRAFVGAAIIGAIVLSALSIFAKKLGF